MKEIPNGLRGLQHLALRVQKLEACVVFYTQLIGMKVVWQPDPDNVYLTSGTDNLALHRLQETGNYHPVQHLDHLGFMLSNIDDVDRWYDFFVANHAIIQATPKTHRDGARSFYCKDPDGNLVQMIYAPPLK